jgi:antitoxin component of RelBE/YafQ-DinJ toxin-antitoxin module
MQAMQKKVTLSVDEKIYKEFQDICDKNAIMLSKRIELFMKEFTEDMKRVKK